MKKSELIKMLNDLEGDPEIFTREPQGFVGKPMLILCKPDYVAEPYYARFDDNNIPRPTGSWYEL